MEQESDVSSCSRSSARLYTLEERTEWNMKDVFVPDCGNIFSNSGNITTMSTSVVKLRKKAAAALKQQQTAGFILRLSPNTSEDIHPEQSGITWSILTQIEVVWLV